MHFHRNCKACSNLHNEQLRRKGAKSTQSAQIIFAQFLSQIDVIPPHDGCLSMIVLQLPQYINLTMYFCKRKWFLFWEFALLPKRMNTVFHRQIVLRNCAKISCADCVLLAHFRRNCSLCRLLHALQLRRNCIQNPYNLLEQLIFAQFLSGRLLQESGNSELNGDLMSAIRGCSTIFKYKKP